MSLRPAIVHSVLTVAALAVASVAQAQIAIDRTQLVLQPDSVSRRSGVMVVRNTGRSRAEAVIRVEDWDRGADGAHRFYEPGTQPGSCASVMTVSATEFSLAPGESRAVAIGLDGAVRSACWSLVLVESAEQVRDPDTGKLVLAAVRTGMKVFVDPAGLRAEGEVSEVEVEHSEAAHNASSALATVTFRNTGDLHLEAQGRLEIRRADDSMVTSVPLPSLQTLPGAAMTARVALPPMPRGTYRLRAVVQYGGATAAAERMRELELR